MNLLELQHHVMSFYEREGREFPWRSDISPYRVVVSEIMLQQTQTDRVIDKFNQFVQELNSFEALACADQPTVLRLWSGLGYNRRALYLHHIAQVVYRDYRGQLPADPQLLRRLKGIGVNTAGSICAFAFNLPVPFIETNIRTVFIHHFFSDAQAVHDRELMPLIEQSILPDRPRDWYYALMDYGVMLKKSVTNPSRKSAHYAKQSRFEGSERQIRGMILRALMEHHLLSFDELCELIHRPRERIERNLRDLCAEGFVSDAEGLLRLRS